MVSTNPGATEVPHGDSSTDREHGQNVSRGPAKRLDQARRTQPQSASVDDVQAIAFRAIAEDVHPADLWVDWVDDRTADLPGVEFETGKEVSAGD